ncbi:MAG: hypothetical protein DRJ42_12025 [Deltaproteobacteria bacterium]|nr:MAG: hypothetical protein DRJ42_12025 [Deltaproteobacteria bacterium]
MSDSGRFDGGNPDVGPPRDYPVCLEECVADGDCTLSGMELDHSCVDGRCLYACATGNDCIPFASGWTDRCAAISDCPGGARRNWACIDLGGEGRCATDADLRNCADLGRVEVPATRIDGGSVMVCGVTTWGCRAGGCRRPVPDPGAPCEADDECPEQFVCDLPTGNCLCDDDADCVGSPEDGHACVEGRCTCLDAAMCGGTVFDGTTFECAIE